MRQTSRLLPAVLLLCLPLLPSCGGAGGSVPNVARGRYLVDHVALCGDCHSPRDEKGGFLTGRWLQGAPLAFQPTVPMPWAGIAPGIAGLPRLTDEQAVRFLCGGDLPGGRMLRPPMPHYRFATSDARDAVAYLRTLPAAAGDEVGAR